MNKEYKGINADCVTLVAEDGDGKNDIGQMLLGNGFVLVDNRKERRLAKLMADYQRAQEKAKKERVCILFSFIFYALRNCFRYTDYSLHQMCWCFKKHF